MEIIFDDAFNRLKTALKVTNDKEVADIFNMSGQALTNRKRRKAFPLDDLKELIRKEPWREIDLQFILTGELSDFEQKNRRFKSATGLKTDLEVIQALEIDAEDFIEGRLNDVFPIAHLYEFANKYANGGAYKAINTDYVITGKTVTVEEFGIHLITMLEKLATLPTEDQINVIDIVNKLYSLRNIIKTLQDD